MKFSSWIAFFAAICLVSCTKDDEFVENSTRMSLSVSVESDLSVRTYLPGGKEVYWTSTDRLIVYGEKSGDIKQVVFSPDFSKACKSGSFSSTAWPSGYVPVYAVNANGALDSLAGLSCTASGIITAFINPAQKIKNAGSYGQSSSSSVGAVSGGGVSMKNVPSVLKFTVERSDITSITIAPIGDEYIAGFVDVDYAALRDSSSEFWTASRCSKSIAVNAVGSAASDGCFSPGTNYCVCVLPQVYEQGFKITMVASDGKIGVREIAKSLDMPRNCIRALSSAVDKGIEFKEVRTIKTLDFTTVGESTFQYGSPAANLPKRTAGYIAAGTDFWGAAYPTCKFNGAVRYWSAGSGALNMAAGTYVRLPRISGYKLTSITDFVVVHSASRNYKITSAVASSYADGVSVKGGEEQSLSSSSSATSFVLKDKYDSTKYYYIVCNSEAGYRFKLVYTPDDQLDPEPTEDAPVTVARWRIKKTDLTASKLAVWSESNKFPALTGDYANEAYISTSSGTVRTSSSDQLAVGNIKSGDAVEFTIPVKSLPAGSTVDFMTTLRAGTARIPKYWIFEYYDGGTWKSVSQDLITASDDSGVKYSLFMTTEDDIFTTFCQNFTLENEAQDQIRMRLRAVGSINCNGGAISASASDCLCFASYSNYYIGCEIAVYRGIPVKDTKKVLFVGNSYTYYNGSYFMLKQIARSQGHDLRLRAAIRGGKCMGEHIDFVHVKAAMAEGGYDYAFLQESALYVAKYYDGTRLSSLADCKAVANKVRQYSPSAQCSIEDCWSSPKEDGKWAGYNDYATFQRSLLGGALSIASQTSSWITPVGISFKRAYDDGFTDLWSTADYSHPSLFGSYIKAVTFYYLIYGDELDENVPDCSIAPATAAKLRGYARKAVMENGNRAKCMAPDVKDIESFL